MLTLRSLLWLSNQKHLCSFLKMIRMRPSFYSLRLKSQRCLMIKVELQPSPTRLAKIKINLEMRQMLKRRQKTRVESQPPTWYPESRLLSRKRLQSRQRMVTQRRAKRTTLTCQFSSSTSQACRQQKEQLLTSSQPPTKGVSLRNPRKVWLPLEALCRSRKMATLNKTAKCYLPCRRRTKELRRLKSTNKRTVIF